LINSGLLGHRLRSTSRTLFTFTGIEDNPITDSRLPYIVTSRSSTESQCEERDGVGHEQEPREEADGLDCFDFTAGLIQVRETIVSIRVA